jgi:non-ribosomal peptide synthase protein (TIGR01720 family)
MGPKTASFRRWIEQLAKSVTAEALAAESTHWLNETRQRAAQLPIDHPQGRGANTVGSVRLVTASLDEERTQALLRLVPALYQTRTEEVLLAALALALAQCTGSPLHLVDLLGQGRQISMEGVDLSRTVGWFTTLYPLLLDSTEILDPGEVLVRVKEACRQVPREGVGYGWLRYLGSNRSISERLAASPEAEILFSYLGEAAPGPMTDLLLVPACEPHGLARDPRGRRRHLLEITSMVSDGRLKSDWAYSVSVYREETVQKLAKGFLQALSSLVDHSRSLDVRRYTPSDFPEAGLDQIELDQLVADLPALGE